MDDDHGRSGHNDCQWEEEAKGEEEDVVANVLLTPPIGCATDDDELYYDLREV